MRKNGRKVKDKEGKEEEEAMHFSEDSILMTSMNRRVHDLKVF